MIDAVEDPDMKCRRCGAFVARDDLPCAACQALERRVPRLVRFRLGRIIYTTNALRTLSSGVAPCLLRHLAGDWGDLCDDDKARNDEALATGGRLLSSYKDDAGTKFWIITEADRSATTVLLPEDY